MADSLTGMFVLLETFMACCVLLLDDVLNKNVRMKTRALVRAQTIYQVIEDFDYKNVNSAVFNFLPVPFQQGVSILAAVSSTGSDFKPYEH